MKNFRAGAVAAFLAAAFAPTANAFDWSVSGHVTMVEPTYMPTYVTFSIDTAAGACPAGSILIWSALGSDEPKQIANAQAILATITTALATGKTVSLYGTNAGCTVQFVHLNPN